MRTMTHASLQHFEVIEIVALLFTTQADLCITNTKWKLKDSCLRLSCQYVVIIGDNPAGNEL